MSDRKSFYPMIPSQVESERIRAMLRMLLDSGDITPMGVRQIERILEDTDGS